MSTATSSFTETKVAGNRSWPIGITASPVTEFSELGQSSAKGNSSNGRTTRRTSYVREATFSSSSSGGPNSSQSSFQRVSAQTGLVLLPHIDPRPQTMTGKLRDPPPMALATVVRTTVPRPVAVTIPHGIVPTASSGDKLTAAEKLALVLVELDRQRESKVKRRTAVPRSGNDITPRGLVEEEKSLSDEKDGLSNIYTQNEGEPELQEVSTVERGRPKERAKPFRIRSSSTTTAALVERRARMDDARISQPGKRKRCLSSPACPAPFTDRHLPAIAERRRQERREAQVRLVQSLPLFARYRLVVEPWLLPVELQKFDRTPLQLPPGVPPIPLHVHVLKVAQKCYGVMSKMFMVASAGSARRG